MDSRWCPDYVKDEALLAYLKSASNALLELDPPKTDLKELLMQILHFCRYSINDALRFVRNKENKSLIKDKLEMMKNKYVSKLVKK